MKKCVWCDKNNADGISLISNTEIYCKDCQLMLLSKYGVGSTVERLKKELIAKGAVIRND